jgi:hypothetical protein
MFLVSMVVTMHEMNESLAGILRETTTGRTVPVAANSADLRRGEFLCRQRHLMVVTRQFNWQIKK